MMNAVWYVNAALRTEASAVAAQERFRQRDVLLELKRTLKQGIKAGQRADQLKRLAFYGASLQTLPACSFVPQEVPDRLTDLGTVRLLHTVLGLLSETGELAQALQSHLCDGKPLDSINLVEECGDIFWYMAILADTLSVTFEDITTRNINKLQTRYAEQALPRNLAAERQVLAQHNQ